MLHIPYIYTSFYSERCAKLRYKIKLMINVIAYLASPFIVARHLGLSESFSGEQQRVAFFLAQIYDRLVPELVHSVDKVKRVYVINVHAD